MQMIERTPTPYDHLIYGPDWHAHTDPDVPETLFPLDGLIGRHIAAGQGARTALLTEAGAVSYAELDQRVARASAALAAAGARAGERVLLFGTDSLDYACLWLGAVRMGVVPAVISDLYKTSDLGYFLDDTAAATLFIDAEQLEKLDALGAQVPPTLARVVVRDAGRPFAQAPAGQPARQGFDALMAAADPVAVSPWRWHANDICYMFYSGGTTGKAKGITHLAHDFVIVPARHGPFWEYSPDDVVYATSRKYFTHGLWPGLLIPLAHGACIVLDRRAPSPDVVLDLLERHKVTKFITVPTILKNILRHAREMVQKPDLSSVHLVISASEKIAPELFENFKAMFGLEILDSIGSSEVTYEWIANRPAEYKRGSLGKPVFGFEIRLVDPEGRDVTQPGISGEAWVKSRTACFFYWRKYDKSRETFVGPWTRTGDNLCFDEDGFFWFVGRDNDVFKVSGLWLSPIEIEAAITAHPDVLEAAVVGVDGADGLTQAWAYVVLDRERADRDALSAELRAAVRPLGGYKVPAEIRYVSALPRTTLMKINRRALREAPHDWE
jgi:benzoate-CoA ligase